MKECQEMEKERQCTECSSWSTMDGGFCSCYMSDNYASRDISKAKECNTFVSAFEEQAAGVVNLFDFRKEKK